MIARESGPLVAIVAGEPSGDVLGALLVHALKDRLPNARFEGIGGARMQAAGVQSLYPMNVLAVRGYVEVLRRLPEILAIRRQLRRRYTVSPPSLFIGVDAPDFNLDLALTLRRCGVPTVQFVSPAIWAWRFERIDKIRRAVTHVLTLFPFEKSIYDQHGVSSTFVGHPLADLLPEAPDRAVTRERLRIEGEGAVVAMLPGSRMAEVRHHAELFVHTAHRLTESRRRVTFLVPLLSREAREVFERALATVPRASIDLRIMAGHAHDAMIASDVVLVASGTATLEAALLNRPMVITYRMPWFSWWIIKRKRRLPFVGLPNILAGAFIVPELLQEHATPDNLAQALNNLLDDSVVRQRLARRFDSIRHDLRRNATATAAEAILPLVGVAG